MRNFNSDDKRFSTYVPFDAVDAFEELRKREGLLVELVFSLSVKDGALGGDGGWMISWVLVSVRINVN